MKIECTKEEFSLLNAALICSCEHFAVKCHDHGFEVNICAGRLIIEGTWEIEECS